MQNIGQMNHGKLVLLLLAIAFVFLMFANSTISLTHPDEVFYIQTAKEMIEHRSILVPYIFGEPQFEKPVLAYWLFVLAIAVGGLNAFAARFFPSLFGIIGVVVTYWLGCMVFNNKKTAFISGVVLSSSFIYIALSRAVLTDMIFSILVVISIAFFYYGYRYQSKKNTGIILCFVFAGLAVLAKGVLGIIFPAVIIGAYLAYKKDWSFFKTRATIWGAIAFAAIALPWHVLMYQRYGQWFIDEYWHNVHVRRIFVAEHRKSNTWYFYLMTMFGGMFPWSLLLLPMVYGAGRALRVRDNNRDVIVFLLLWVVLTLAIAQVAQSKLASYVFPVFPAIALLVGKYFHDALEGTDRMRQLLLWLSGAMGCILLGVAISGIIYAQKYINVIGSMGPVYIIAGLAVICAFWFFALCVRKKMAHLIIAFPSVTGIVLTCALLMSPHIEPWVSCRNISEAFKKIGAPKDAVVLCAKFYVRGVRYYTDQPVAVIDINGKGFFSPHPIPFLSTDAQVMDFLTQNTVTYGILKESNLKDLRRIASAHYRITVVEEMGGKYLTVIEKI